MGGGARTPLLSAIDGWFWAAPIAVAPGWVGYVLTQSVPEALVRENLGGNPGIAFLWMLGSVPLVVGLWALLARSLRRSNPELAPRDAWRDAMLSTRLLLLGPIVLALIWDPDGHFSMRRPVGILLGAALVALSLRTWPAIPERWTMRLAGLLGGRRWPVLPIAVGTGIATFLLVRLAFWRHHAFETRAFDLAIYDNIAFNTSHGELLRCTLIKGGVHTAAHYDPIMIPISWIHALEPRAETLIVVQAIWVMSAVIPIYLIAMRRLDDRLAATILALALPLHPTIHGILQHDFHSFALLAMPALWMIWCCDSERKIGYWVAFAVVLSIREDAALFASGIGVYLILATEQRRRGVLTIALALVWLVFVKLAVMPDPALLMTDSPDNYTYANRYRRLIPAGGGAIDGFWTLLTNPGFVVVHVLALDKLFSIVVLLLPLAFMPLGGGRRLLLSVYGLAFLLLATHKGIYYPLNHYASALYPCLFAAAPEGLARTQAWLVEHRGLSAGRARAMSLGALASFVLLSSLAMGSLLGKPAFRPDREAAGFGAQDRERLAWFLDAIAVIPPDASVTTTNRTAPHLSSRRNLYIVQQGIEGDWFVIYEDDLTKDERKWVNKLLRTGKYELVAQRGDEFRVMRRVAAE